MIYQRQQEYYQAINQSSASGQSTPFIEFMLDTIEAEILGLSSDGVKLHFHTVQGKEADIVILVLGGNQIY